MKKKPDTRLIDEARKNVLETALEMERTIRYIDALRSFGYSIFDPMLDDESRQFHDGIAKCRSAIFSKYGRALANCFMWVGIDKGLKDYSLQKLRDRFSKEEEKEIMSFLSCWGNIPHSYDGNIEETFRSEVLEEIERIDKK
jgi:hypothetical protein